MRDEIGTTTLREDQEVVLPLGDESRRSQSHALCTVDETIRLMIDSAVPLHVLAMIIMIEGTRTEIAEDLEADLLLEDSLLPLDDVILFHLIDDARHRPLEDHHPVKNNPGREPEEVGIFT